MRAFVIKGTMTAVAVAGLLLALAQPAWVQESAPRNTNPAKRVVYPAGGQTAAQQTADELTCHNWSSDRTGWNPQVAYADLEANHGAALRQYEASIGGAVRGAAGGALLGLAIGAIAGDAGQGAAIGAVAGGATGGLRARRGRMAASASFEDAASEFMSSFEYWDRHWVACMDGHGYSVN